MLSFCPNCGKEKPGGERCAMVCWGCFKGEECGGDVGEPYKYTTKELHEWLETESGQPWQKLKRKIHNDLQAVAELWQLGTVGVWSITNRTVGNLLEIAFSTEFGVRHLYVKNEEPNA